MSKKIVKGWTCTCNLKAIQAEIAKRPGKVEILSRCQMKNVVDELKSQLVKTKKEVLCYQMYWNHDKDGKPVKVEIDGLKIKEL